MIHSTIDTLRILFENPYHHQGIEVIKWWWFDALFMAPPVLAKLVRTLNDPKYSEYNDRYFKKLRSALQQEGEALRPRPELKDNASLHPKQ